MPWLLWRELVVMVRTPSVWIAAAGHVTLLALFLVVWGSDMPVLTGSPDQQFLTVHWAWLGVLMPWLAVRLAVAGAHGAARVATLAAGSPSQFLWARTIAIAVILLAVVLTALPLSLFSVRIAAAGPSTLIDFLGACGGLCAFAAVAAIASALAMRHPLTAWLIATAVVWATMQAVPPRAWPWAGVGAVGFALTAVLAAGSSRFSGRSARLAPHAS